MEHRLPAILAADVVGDSRLIGEEEVGTIERLMTPRNEPEWRLQRESRWSPG